MFLSFFFFFGSKAHGSWFSIKWLKKIATSLWFVLFELTNAYFTIDWRNGYGPDLILLAPVLTVLFICKLILN